MKRGVIGALGLALAVGVLTTTVTTFGTASAQERETDQDRVVRTLSVLGGGSYLGVRIEDVTEELAEELGLPGEYGVHVASVVEEGPAASAGVQDGDVILRWNGERVQGATQLQRLVRETPVGRTVQLGVFRAGSQQELSVELGESSGRFGNLRIGTAPRLRGLGEELRDRIRSVAPGEVHVIGPGDVRVRGVGDGRVLSFMGGRGRLGVSVQNLGDQLAEYFGVEDGALVTSVVEDSPAEAAGIRAGDVILEVAGEEVEGPGELVEILSEQEAGPVTILVMRDRQQRTLTVELEERARWRHQEGDHEEGDQEGDHEGDQWSFHLDPFEMPAFQFAPIHVEGFEMEPFEWHFDFGDGEWIDTEDMTISIPEIRLPDFDLPAIELPAIEVPGFEVEVPRVQVTTRV
jgi:serine protease Do